MICLHYEIITTDEKDAKILMQELGSRLHSAFAYYAKAVGYYAIKEETESTFIVKVGVPVIEYDLPENVFGLVENIQRNMQSFNRAFVGIQREYAMEISREYKVGVMEYCLEKMVKELV